jgi:LysM repeat protein
MFGITGGADFLVTVTADLPTGKAVPERAHVVARGENLVGLAHRYGQTVAQLAALNPGIRNLNRIRAGQVIRVR